ncbi:hypothetical protein ABPG75_000674 [Micractinium tetrahymenae]
MARKQAVALLALSLLIAGAAGQALTKESVQAFVNDVSNKVSAVQLVAPPEAQAMLAQISLSVNSIATAWWEIDWASQQSQWDTLVQAANTVVLQIQMILPSIPEDSGNTWGSIYPRQDMLDAAAEICEQIAGMKAYAESTYSVLLTITSMSACDAILPADAPTQAPAPAPAVSRRMLAA